MRIGILILGLLCSAASGWADEALDLYLKGNAFSRSGQFEEAVDAYHQALAANPEATGPFYNLGLAYKNLRQYERAAGAFEGALQREPDNPHIQVQLGNIYNRMERWEKAIGHLNRVVHRVSGNAEAHGNLGWAYLNYSKGPPFKKLVLLNLQKAVDLFEQQNQPEAAAATRQTLAEARKKLGVAE